MRKHLFIPDSQVRSDVPLEYLSWIGNYIVDKKPDVIVHIGDFADMPSLSHYDKGKAKMEGRRYEDDITAAHYGMGRLCGPMMKYNNKMRKQKGKLYKPEMHLTLGNHEDRITRYAEDNPQFEGKVSIHNDLKYHTWGWKVHDYLDVVTIDGVSYSHYFYLKKSGRPYSGMAETRLKNVGFSFVQGHQQEYIIGIRDLNDGTRQRCLVCGSCYLHDELYRGPQANGEWRGIFMLHEVNNGDYNLMEVSLDYLCRRYEGVGVAKFMKKKYPDIYNKSQWMKKLHT